MQTLIQAIQHYQPYNEQEENDRRVMLKLLETQPDILDRSNQVAHTCIGARLHCGAHRFCGVRRE